MHRTLDVVLHSYQVIHLQRINSYGDVLPLWWYVVMQRDPLYRDPLVSESSGRGRVAGHDFVPPLHMVPCLLVEGGVRGHKFLILSSGCLHPPPPVRLQNFCNLAAEVLEESLVTRGILAHQ